jgi:hypothetical protein
MPTLTDFTFNNDRIKAYFNGNDAYVPSSELLYLHSHPLIRPNFLTEIEDTIKQTTDLMVKRKMKGPLVDRFTNLVKEYGVEVNNFTELNAPKTLDVLRRIYQLCLGILGNR